MDAMFSCYNVYIQYILVKCFKKRQTMQHNHAQLKLFILQFS